MGWIYESKYQGLIESKEKEVYTPENILFLIEKKIYVEYISEVSDIEIFYNGNPYEYNKEDTTEFDTYITFKGKTYTLSDDVKEDIYLTLKFYVEEILNNVDYIKDGIELKLKRYSTAKDKISFLRNQQKKYIKKVETDTSFLIYSENKEVNGFDNWKDLVIDYYTSEVINIYLTDKKATFSKKIKDWVIFYEVKSITDFIKQKIQELETENKEILETTENKQVYDTSLQVLLFDKIMKIDNWDELSDNKKAELMSLFSDKNKDNIRKIFAMINKKSSETTQKFKADSKKADEILSKILN